MSEESDAGQPMSRAASTEVKQENKEPQPQAEPKPDLVPEVTCLP